MKIFEGPLLNFIQHLIMNMVDLRLNFVPLFLFISIDI